MRQTIFRYIPLVAIALCLWLLWSFFHVRGSEIDLASDISDSCTVTVSAYELLDWENRTECVLNTEQTQDLKELILSSSFTRQLKSVVYNFDPNLYDIQIDFNNGQDFLSIHCLGNDYISVTNQFGGKHLKINNEAWVETLEEILAEPTTE